MSLRESVRHFGVQDIRDETLIKEAAVCLQYGAAFRDPADQPMDARCIIAIEMVRTSGLARRCATVVCRLASAAYDKF